MMRLLPYLLLVSAFTAPAYADTVLPQFKVDKAGTTKNLSVRDPQSGVDVMLSVLNGGASLPRTTKATASSGAVAMMSSTDQTITGTATLGQPSTGYNFVLGASNVHARLINSSGWNQATAGNDGRTGVTAFTALLEQRGQGDVMGFYANCQIFSAARAGATHWLAQPACAVGGANIATLTPHSYLQGFEFNYDDNGVEAAAIGQVNNFNRTANSASFGEVWMGDRWQSNGSKAIDVGWSAAGKVNVGLDTVTASADAAFNGGKIVALNMGADQKILLNSTATPLNGVSYYGNNLGSASIGYVASTSSVLTCNAGSCTGLSSAGILFIPKAIRLAPLTYSALTALVTCDSTVEGVVASVSDSGSATFNALLSGGGSNHVMAYCNGTNWTVH